MSEDRAPKWAVERDNGVFRERWVVVGLYVDPEEASAGLVEHENNSMRNHRIVPVSQAHFPAAR